MRDRNDLSVLKVGNTRQVAKPFDQPGRVIRCKPGGLLFYGVPSTPPAPNEVIDFGAGELSRGELT